MNKVIPNRLCGLFLAISASLFAGCQTHTQTGALAGSGIGALAGAIIGHQTGNRDAGALIGATVGGLGGAAVGHAEDMAEERDNALHHAAHSEMSRVAAQQAVTNQDVVNMTRQGFSDQHIIITLKDRGGRFDTSPTAQGYLKEQGVSEQVLQAMMQYTPKY